ncbi:kinase-like protein [Rhizodiscina lignyota]|uniref:non-specific serine/threonine protein kinase n=1 Tax=Rhizodiscina lignyota TaxID=1504668 RepID=A0A9P4I5X3_9PEZI|nr:kinase-like protein [Rhizodiscina lignyota]
MDTPPHTPSHSAKKSVSSITTGFEGSMPRFVPETSWALSIQPEDFTEENFLGSGRSSNVYKVVLHNVTSSPFSLTPPTSPVKSSFGKSASPVRAVKVPVDKASRKILRDEARIHSQLAHRPEYMQHVVGFFGLDESLDAIVMEACEMSLESFINKDLGTLSRDMRIGTVAASYKLLASQLITGLQFVHSNGVIHGDIKPGNILLRAEESAGNVAFPFKAVYCDFSSAKVRNADWKRESEDGGGTWDYMAPRLLTYKGSNEGPDEDSDGYALMMTVLYYVLGGSPYRQAQNGFQRREWAKQGAPIVYAMDDMELENRFKDLEEKVGDGVKRWFEQRLKGNWRELKT